MYRYALILLIFVLNSSVEASYNPYCALPCGNVKHACCRFEHSHPGPKCRSPYKYHKMTNDDRALVIMMHNAIRNNVASGTDPFLPRPASNMLALVYDLELEFLASCWSTQCRKKKYDCLDSKRGPTAHYIWQDKERRSGKTSGKTVLTQSILNFYKQLETMDRESIKNFTDTNLTPYHSLLSQVLWADTQFVGCSRVTFGADIRRYKVANIVCVYYPKGNIEFQPIYKIGKPCSDCPEGNHCHANYTSLCTPYLKRKLDTFEPPYEMAAPAFGPSLSGVFMFLCTIFFYDVFIQIIYLSM